MKTHDHDPFAALVSQIAVLPDSERSMVRGVLIALFEPDAPLLRELTTYVELPPLTRGGELVRDLVAARRSHDIAAFERTCGELRDLGLLETVKQMLTMTMQARCQFETACRH